jgi:short-subunit dehydrogenase
MHAAKEIEGTRKSSDGRVQYLPLDVSENTMTADVMEQAVSEMGSPDVLINSAGRSSPNYFENITYDQFAETMTTNLFGTRNTIAALLPHMKKNGGHIINVSSLAGFVGVFGFTDYCASKFGMIGFSEALRSECKKFGILVSVLCPPDTDTPMLKAENATKPAETIAVSETGGLLSADFVAQTMIKGIGKKRFMIIPGAMGKLTFIAKRLLPGIVEAVMDWEIKKVQGR